MFKNMSEGNLYIFYGVVYYYLPSLVFFVKAFTVCLIFLVQSFIIDMTEIQPDKLSQVEPTCKDLFIQLSFHKVQFE